MRRIKVEIVSETAEDKGPALFIVETDRGAGFSESERRVVAPDKFPGGTLFELGENQQLIVDPYPPEAVAYDEEQKAAYVVANQKDPREMDSPGEEVSPAEKKATEEREAWEEKVAQKEAKERGEDYKPQPKSGVGVQKPEPKGPDAKPEAKVPGPAPSGPSGTQTPIGKK